MSVVHQASNVAPEIHFSEAAIKHITTSLDKQKQYHGIRFSVKKTGCSGLSYVVDYVTEPVATDLVVPFMPDYLVWLDKASYPFLNAVRVDYVKQGLNYKFVFENPNQTGQCGCGESFTVTEDAN